jgi:hypothetical protein
MWDVILPIDDLIFFKMVKTTNQIYIYTLYTIYINVYIYTINIYIYVYILYCAYSKALPWS